MPTFLTYPSPFTLLLLLLVPTPSVSTNSSDTPDYPYKACVPTNCGRGPNITFPFYVRDRQQSFCGFPGFPIINCSSQGFPLLQLSQNGDQYIVHDIFYDSQTLRVYNAEAARSGQDGCFPEIRNLTDLSTSLIGMADNVTKTYLFASCNDSMSSDGIEIGSGCKWDLAMDEKGENFSRAMNKCRKYVVVRVEEGAGTGIGRNLGEALQTGFAMHWTAPKCNRCLTSGGLCGFNVSSYRVMCFCPHGPRRTRCRSPEKSEPKLIIATVVTGVSVFLLTCFLCFLAWHGHRIKNLWFTRNMSEVDMEVASTSYFGIPIFAYQDLQLATNNFDASKELGDGAHGAVYYGKLGNGREVAVKRLYEHNNRRMDQFINEIKILTCLRHQNLVSLYGCTSRTSKELLLVYEYVPNGTLADHLHGTRASVGPMPWAVRLKIAIETAAALSYLHNSGIIHRDVKSDNILLNNNFSVKVADFGLSRLFPTDATHISTSPQGTLGYVDPEYYQCYRVTDKSDVYSFGVVLIELLSSMPAVDINRDEVSLATMAINKIKMREFDEMIEPALGHREDAWVARMTMAVTEMAFRCLQADKDMRPSMDEILDGLREIAESGAEDSIKDVIVGNDGEEDVIKDVIFVENVGAAKSEMDEFVPLKSKDFQTSSYSADVA